jgi:polyhydroxyalkanoate synthesis regulator phasin
MRGHAAVKEHAGKETVMTVAEVIRKAVLAGIGAQEKTKEFIEELVKAGELSKHEGAALVKEWISKAEQSAKDTDFKIKDAIAATLEKLSIPSHDDLDRMEKKIQSLSARLSKIEAEGGKNGA